MFSSTDLTFNGTDLTLPSDFHTLCPNHPTLLPAPLNAFARTSQRLCLYLLTGLSDSVVFFVCCKHDVGGQNDHVDKDNLQ